MKKTVKCSLDFDVKSHEDVPNRNEILEALLAKVNELWTSSEIEKQIKIKA